MALKNSIDQLIRDEWNKRPRVGEEIKQLTIWDAIGNEGQKNGSGVPPTSPTPEPTPEQKMTAWVQVYHVTRRGEKHKYFRFCYLSDPNNIRSLTRVHLPGGNIESALALALKQKVESAIANGMSVRAIVGIIKSNTNR